MKQIRDLKSEALKVSGLDIDRRFKRWVKFVDRVDESQSNGFAFIGEFVGDGTVEVEVKPRLLLLCAESGSMKYHYGYYVAVAMSADGSLSLTDIRTDNKTPGWALRIRGAVVDRLKELEA